MRISPSFFGFAVCALFGGGVFAPLRGAIVINEFVASNGTTLADEDGDYPDWIELYNPSAEIVSLDGWGLSDRTGEPFRWVFPAISLEGGEFLVVFASSKNRRVVDQPLHTNFAISAAGEPLYITTPGGEQMDFVPPVALLRDQSYARIPDGSANWTVTDFVTPGAPNKGAVLPPVSPPRFAPSGGFFTDAPSVTLMSDDAEATILYTVDGSEPRHARLEGEAYIYKNQFPWQPGDPLGEFLWGEMRTFFHDGGPLVAARNPAPPLSFRATTNEASPANHVPLNAPYAATVLRARTVKEGHAPGPVVTATYFAEPDPLVFAGDLPVLSITLDSRNLFDYISGIYTAGYFFDDWRERNPHTPTELWTGWANYYRSGSDTEARAHLEWFEPDGTLGFARDIALRLHGGTSRSYPQKSLRIYAGSNFDPRGEIHYPVFPGLRREPDGAPVERFHRLILRNSGNDHDGTRIRDAVAQRILEPLGMGTQAYRPAIHFINGEFWGLINIRERLDRFYVESRFSIPEDEVGMVQITSGGDELQDGHPQDVADFSALREYMRTHDLSQPAAYAWVAARLDIDGFLLHHMAQIFLKNTDWPGSNIRLWRSPGGPWRYLFFDFDFAMGPFWGLENNHNTLAFALAEGGTEWPNPDWSTIMLRRLLLNEGFRNRFIQAFADHIPTTFHASRVDAIIDEMHAQIAPYLEAHGARWRNFRNDDPVFMKDFARERPEHVIRHLRENFDLAAPVPVTFAISSPEGGAVRVNTRLPNPDGRPFTQNYFPGVPLEVEFVPHEGFAFAGWEGTSGEEGPRVEIDPGTTASLTALVRKEPDSQAPAAQQWMQAGIFLGGQLYFHAAIGRFLFSPSWAPYLYLPDQGWAYLQPDIAGSGTYLYLHAIGEWAYLPDADLPLAYFFDRAQWQVPALP